MLPTLTRLDIDTPDTTRPQETAERCPRCQQRPAEPLHTCPYREELSDDPNDHCTCCPDCTDLCREDI